MKIKYLSCDGKTEVEEEVESIGFYEGTDYVNNKIELMMLCKRSTDDYFEVSCKDVFNITN